MLLGPYGRANLDAVPLPSAASRQQLALDVGQALGALLDTKEGVREVKILIFSGGALCVG